MDLSGFANLDAKKCGENGRCLCRVCGKEVPVNRRTFCSRACVATFRIQTDPAFARRQVFARDHGVCQMCGLDTETLLEEKVAEHMARGLVRSLARLEAIKAIMAVWGYTGSHRRRSLWDMDHVQAVVLGGTNKLANLRTLCIPCHKLETRNLMRSLRGSHVLRRYKRHR